LSDETASDARERLIRAVGRISFYHAVQVVSYASSFLDTLVYVYDDELSKDELQWIFDVFDEEGFTAEIDYVGVIGNFAAVSLRVRSKEASEDD
jgi:hypothetical protein